MIRRIRTAAGLLCAVGLLLVVPRADAKDGGAESVRMPVEYRFTMLVIVSREGAAAVRFVDGFETGNETGNGIVGTFYEWRYLERKPDAVEETGKGRVYAKLKDGKVQHGSFDVHCGPRQLVWSHKDQTSGSVEYDPEAVSVYPVSVDYFGTREGPNQRIIVADLSHFLYRDEASEKQHRYETKPGPEAERRWSANQIAGPIRYGGCVVIARDPNGIAALKFKKAFHRKVEDDVTLDGVEYTYTFTSHDGKTIETGAGEVYERRKGNQYDKGRLLIEAGPIHFTWSLGGDDLGWAYFDPTWSRISYADAAHEAALVKAVTRPDRAPGDRPAK